MRRIFILLFLTLCLTLAACSGEPESRHDASYESTKKMVVDILQTDEGKKTLTEVMNDKKIKEQLVVNSDETKKTITDTLTSDKGKEMWQTLFQDNDFKDAFAKSMAEEQKKLIKALMNDPEYQKQMLGLLQNEKMQEQMLRVMTSQPFREHLSNTMKETFETPALEKKLQDIMIEANKKADEKKAEEEKKSK